MFGILEILRRKQCVCCGKKSWGTVNYAGYDICSEECMIKFFNTFSINELIELEIKDMKINKDYYNWLERKNGGIFKLSDIANIEGEINE